MVQEREKEDFYHEALVVLSGMGIQSNNKVMTPNGGVITAQEYLKEKLRYGKNLSGTTDKITVENLQERCDRYEKALTEVLKISETHDEDTVMSVIADISHDALVATGGDDEKV